MVDRPFPEGSRADEVSLSQLERLREAIRSSVDRTEAELEQVEGLILAAAIREQRRSGVEGSAELPINRIESVLEEPPASVAPVEPIVLAAKCDLPPVSRTEAEYP
jgi:hypothetical protein